MPSSRLTPRRLTRFGVVVAVLAAAAVVTLLPGGSTPARAEALVPYPSCDELLAHYRSELERTATAWGSGGGYGGTRLFGPGAFTADSSAPVPAAARAESAEQSSTADAVGSGPTGTNVQEQGVDEPDTAKLVDGLLYTLAQGGLQIVRAGESPQLLGRYDLGPDSGGGELLVEGDRVLVLTTDWRPAPAVDDAGPDAGLGRFVPDGGGTPVARLTLLDVSVPAAPQLLEQLEVDGRYLSARLVDGTVRLVTASSPASLGVQPAEPYGAEQEQAALEENREAARSAPLSEVLPQLVRRGPDGEVLAEQPAVGCDAVRHASSPHGVSTLLVSTLRLDRGLQPLHSTGVTTDGDLVYASADRLYVATSRWGTVPPAVPAPAVPAPSETPAPAPAPDEVSTELHAFDTSGPDGTSYLGSGSVGGYVLGRWALSAHEGHLRVATTRQAPWSTGGEQSSSSSLTVLAERDGQLVQTGRVDDLGPGERIYAVRYFGTLATVVTFRQTDPLYVLDLADVAAPRLLGELKVPGFSTYLHPVGGDRLLGVGQEADSQGRVTGMQVSLFDLSDRSAPTQLDRLQLGDGWSPALEDSRAFGYDPARRQALLPFMAFSGAVSPGPVEPAPPSGLPSPGLPTGEALAIAVGEDGTLSLAGRLPGGSQGAPERVLHDADHVYAVGQQGVQVGTADGLQPAGSVRFTG